MTAAAVSAMDVLNAVAENGDDYGNRYAGWNVHGRNSNVRRFINLNKEAIIYPWRWLRKQVSFCETFKENK
jgi:hypothetical protein